LLGFGSARQGDGVQSGMLYSFEVLVIDPLQSTIHHGLGLQVYGQLFCTVVGLAKLMRQQRTAHEQPVVFYSLVFGAVGTYLLSSAPVTESYLIMRSYLRPSYTSSYETKLLII
jgi:hypothetical protein